MEVSSHHSGVVVVPLEGQCRVIVTLNIVSLMLAVFLEWFHFTYDLTTTNLAVCVPPTSPIHCLQLTMSAARADDNDYVSALSHTHFVLSLFLSLLLSHSHCEFWSLRSGQPSLRYVVAIHYCWICFGSRTRHANPKPNPMVCYWFPLPAIKRTNLVIISSQSRFLFA